MRHFFEETPQSLEEWATGCSLPRHVGSQLLQWVYGKGVLELGAMSDLSRQAREAALRDFTFCRGAVVQHQCATDETQKLLLEWPSEGTGEPLALAPRPRRTECVLIPADGRRTACISSQVGCPVGCAFCASGVGGLEGNLTTGQIVEQVSHLRAIEGVERVSHVVFMGMGEPLANFTAVTAAIRTLNATWGFGISARRITVSTVGLPAAIRRLCTFELPVTLALSLHAPNDELRRKIIPWAEYATIAELLSACEEWFTKTGREITLEYILLGKFNDRPEHALELAGLARRLRANVNLIRYNEVKGMPFSRPGTEDVREFQEVLRSRGVNAHIRASRGRDIAAACGQLRHQAVGV